MNWREISYLKTGTPRQREAYETLVDLEVLEALDRFDPALVSTVCVGLDTAESDLDLICDVRGRPDLRAAVERRYGGRPRFRTREREDGAVVAQFETDAFPVEVFGTARPVERQVAWRHLSVMKRLVEAEPRLRERVRALKREGMGTEPAIAHLLGLEGDPYEAVLALEEATEEQLVGLCEQAV
jgi:hypothetical protein